MYLFMVIIFGLLIGSFLNVCIYRIPEGKSISVPRSHCTTCKHTLGVLDLIPVVSYLLLGGKCRYCKTAFSPRYMFVELLTALSFVGVYLCHGATFDTIMYCIFAAFLIVLTMIDFDHMILPTSIIVTGWLIGVMCVLIRALGSGEIAYLWEPLVASAIGYGIFYIMFYAVQYIYKKEGLGFGDVRLMGVLGLFTSIHLVFFIIFVASLVASVYGIFQYIKFKESKPFAFGPFLCLGAYISVLVGYDILAWYMGLFGVVV